MNPLAIARTVWTAWRYAGQKSASGDPHIRDGHGNVVHNHFESGKFVLLLRSEHAAIVGEIGRYFGPVTHPLPPGCVATVFVRHAIELGGGVRVLMSGNGAPRRVDGSGRETVALRDGEVVHAPADPRTCVRYRARRRKLMLTLTGEGRDTFGGWILGTPDEWGGYIDMMGRATPGARFEGFFPSLKENFRGLEVDPTTGAGMFTPGPDGRPRTNDDFYVSGLWDGLRNYSLTSTMSFV